MDTTTTRRALIGGAGLAAVAAAVPAIAVVRAPAVSTAKWDALVAAFQKADARMKTLGAEHTAAFERYAVEADKIGPRPTEPDCSSREYPKPIEHMTIAEIKANPIKVPPEYAAYEAALAAWKAKDAALEATITSDIEAHWEAAVDAQDNAAHALFAEPSPDAAALCFKMQLVETSYQGCDLDDGVTKAIFADVRRLLSKEA